jgi:predicted membrane channel-forming protein YqfA (hemolysin III family)
MNVWTHVIAALAFAIYAVERSVAYWNTPLRVDAQTLDAPSRLAMQAFDVARHPQTSLQLVHMLLAVANETVDATPSPSSTTAAPAFETTLGSTRAGHLASIVVQTALYLASALYHGAARNQWWSAYLRWLDITFIYLALSASWTANVLVAALGDTRNRAAPLVCVLPDVPWQTWVDPLLAALVIVCAFTVIRFLFEPASTWAWMGFEHTAQTLWGTRRQGHVDGRFAPVRRVSMVVLFLGWVPSAAYELAHLPRPFGAATLAINAVGTALVVLVATNDSNEYTDRRLARCVSWTALVKRIPTSHTIWHLVTFLFSVLAVGVREAALARALHDAHCLKS